MTSSNTSATLRHHVSSICAKEAPFVAHPLTSTESPRTSFELAKCARVSIVRIYLHPTRTYFIPTCEMGEVSMTMMGVCFLSIVAQSIQKPEQFSFVTVAF